MRRILAIGITALTLMFAGAVAYAQPTSGSVTQIRTAADCTVVACVRTGQVCISGSTMHACNTGTGFFVAVGSAAPTPPGANTQVPFNDSGVYGADSGLVFNKTTDVLTTGGGLVCTTGDIIATAGNVNVAGGSKVNLEASAGDTYLTRTAGVAVVDIYKDATLGLTVKATGIEPAACPADLGAAGIVACIKDGNWVFCGASGCRYIDGTVAQ